MFCCCATSEERYDIDLIYEDALDRNQVVRRMEKENENNTCLFRVLGFLLHFGGYYGILYPLIMLIGMIPFIGAVGATILIFIAFFFACMSFIFLIACAWICARPFLAIILFGFIGILVIVGKNARDKLVEEGYIKEENDNNNNRIISTSINTVTQKFLGF